MKKTVLSCIQPTGSIHFGNYYGAVKNWVDLQKKYECMFGVVDYHAMTMPYDPEQLNKSTWNMIKSLVACGVHVENLFIQSLIPEHTELAWILNCLTSTAELERQPQFKDKKEQLEKQNKSVSNGFFSYPVLQAGDILIYQADLVPVGIDQKQHIELCRTLANRFNKRYKKKVFNKPQALFTRTPKIKSLVDPQKKMSKSLGEKHYIGCFDDASDIRKKIRSAVTDDPYASGISEGIQNLLTLLVASGEIDKAKFFEHRAYNKNLRNVDLKEAVIYALTNESSKFKQRLLEIENNEAEHVDRIYESSANIRQVARKTLDEVRNIVGVNPMKIEFPVMA